MSTIKCHKIKMAKINKTSFQIIALQKRGKKTTKNVQCKTDALLMKNKVQGERNLRTISHEQCFLFYYVVFFFVFIKENENWSLLH